MTAEQLQPNIQLKYKSMNTLNNNNNKIEAARSFPLLGKIKRQKVWIQLNQWQTTERRKKHQSQIALENKVSILYYIGINQTSDTTAALLERFRT